MDWRKKQELKEWYRSQGVPVGVGMPEQDPPEEIQQMQDDQLNDALTEQAMYGGMGGEEGYTPPYISNDKAKIIDFINRMEPLKRDEKGNPVEGEVPMEVMFEGGLFAFYAHNATMSNLDEKELPMMRNKLKTIINATIGGMDKGSFTPKMFAYMEGAEAQALLRLNQNKHGQERYFSGVESSDMSHSYTVSEKKSIKDNLRRALSGGRR